MFAQLGNIVFSGPASWVSLEHKDTTTYAQHDLIGGKPVISPTGNDLEEFTIGMKLRPEFVNPEQARLQLKKSKDSYEVLPYIRGNGQYMGDYVITEMSTTSVQTLADGTPVELTLSITLKEYVSVSKLEQQQDDARKQAFAVGDKTPLRLGPVQERTSTQLAGDDLSSVNSFNNEVDRTISEYSNNVTRRPGLATRVQQVLEKIDSRLESLKKRLENLPLPEDVKATISDLAGTVQDKIGEFQFPVPDVGVLRLNGRNLQQAVQALNSGSAFIKKLIITRGG